MKKKFTILLSCLFAAALIALPVTSAQAKGCEKCAKSKKSSYDKILWKMKAVLAHAEELKVTDQQFKKIEDLIWSTKKGYAEQKGMLKPIKVDIQHQRYLDTVDLDALEKLVDKKYDIKKEMAKVVNKAYAEFKKILTDEQKMTMKKEYFAKKYGSEGCDGKGSTCPMKKKK